jgi:hypothetical protein
MGSNYNIINIGDQTTSVYSNKKRVFIGNPNDSTIISGSLNVYGRTLFNTPPVQVTSTSTYNNINSTGSSSSFGLYIADGQDLSNATATTLPLLARSFIRMSNDTQSFIFQPTGFITTSNSNGVLSGIYNPNPISIGKNLTTGSTNNSIVILQPSSTSDASYQMVSSYFDLSSVLQRDISNSTLDSQKINTDLVINGNTFLNKALAIGTTINGNSYSINMTGNIYQNTSTINNGFIIQF